MVIPMVYFKRFTHILIIFSYLNALITPVCAGRSANWEETNYTISIKRTRQTVTQKLRPQTGLSLELLTQKQDSISSLGNSDPVLRTFIPDNVWKSPEGLSQFTNIFLNDDLKKPIGLGWQSSFFPSLTFLIFQDGSFVVQGQKEKSQKCQSLTLSSPGTISIQDLEADTLQIKARRFDVHQGNKSKILRVNLNDKSSVMHIFQEGNLETQVFHLLNGTLYNQGWLGSSHNQKILLHQNSLINTGTLEVQGPESSLKNAFWFYNAGIFRGKKGRVKARLMDTSQGSVVFSRSIDLDLEAFKSAKKTVLETKAFRLKSAIARLSGLLNMGDLRLDVSDRFFLAGQLQMRVNNLTVRGSGKVEVEKDLSVSVGNALHFSNFKGIFLNRGCFKVHSLTGKCFEMTNGPGARFEGDGNLTISTFQNLGFMGGSQLCLEIQKEMFNPGTLKFHDVSGNGHLETSGILYGVGSKSEPTVISVDSFENHAKEGFPNSGRIEGTFLSFKENGRVKNSGTLILKNELRIQSPVFENNGVVQVPQMSVKKLLNGVEGNIVANNLNISAKSTNRGELKVLKKLCLPQKKPLISQGTLEVGGTGIYSLYSYLINKGTLRFFDTTSSYLDRLENTKTGVLKSHGGLRFRQFHNEGVAEIHKIFSPCHEIYHWYIPRIEGIPRAPVIFTNSGSLLLNEVSLTSDIPKIVNQGDLVLKNIKKIDGLCELVNEGSLSWSQKERVSRGQIPFDMCLGNHGTARFKPGIYAFQELFNHGTMALIGEKWWIEKSSQESNKNLLISQIIKNLGEIAAEKYLTYQHPDRSGKLMAVQGLEFNGANREVTDEDIKGLSTDGTLKILGRNLTVIQPLALPCSLLKMLFLGKLELSASLRSPSMDLIFSKGAFIGQNNEKMGSLVATEGALSLYTKEIDARYGKIFGKEKVWLHAVDGDVQVGALKNKPSQFPRVISGNTLNNPKYQKKTLNGAYVASDGSVSIAAPQGSIFVDYGEIFSSEDTSLTAQKQIRSISGRIKSRRDIKFEAPKFLLTRPNLICVSARSPNHRYTNLKYYLECADASKVHSGGDIYFNVPNVEIQYSDAFSGKRIYHFNKIVAGTSQKYQGFFKLVSRNQYYTENFCGRHYNHQDRVGKTPASIIAGETVNIETGDVALTGSMHAPIIHLKAQTGYFANPNQTRSQNSTTTLSIDLVDFARAHFPEEGFMKALPDGRVTTDREVSGGWIPTNNQLLVHHNASQTTIPRFLIDPPVLNFVIQSALASVAGTLNLQGRSGQRLMQQLFHNTQEYREENNLEVFDPAHLQKIQKAMIVYKARELTDQIAYAAQLLLPATVMNPYRDSGDISGDRISIETTEDQRHVSNRVIAKKFLKILAEGNLRRENSKYTREWGHGKTHVRQEVSGPKQQMMCLEGDTEIIGEKDYTEVGVATFAGRDLRRGSTKGNAHILDQVLKTTETRRESKSSGFLGLNRKSKTTTRVIYTSVPSQAFAGRHSTIISEKDCKTDVRGSKEQATGNLIFEGGEADVSAHILKDTIDTTEKRKSALGSSTKSSAHQENAKAFRVLLKAGRSIIFRNQKARVRGVDVVTPLLSNQTRDGLTLGPTIETVRNSSKVTQKGWVGKQTTASETGQEIEARTRVKVGNIESTKSPIHLVNVDWVGDKPKIRGQFKETYRALRSWSHSHTEGSLMDPAVSAVIGLAVSLALCGLDGGASAATGLGFAAGSVEAAVVNGGLAVLVTQATVSCATHGGDLDKVFEDVTSRESLRSMAQSMVTAGVVKGLGDYMGLPSNPQGWEEHLKVQAVHAAVNVAADVTMGGQDIEDALKSGLKSFTTGTVGGVLANEIGKAYGGENPSLNYLTHKVAHGVLGGVIGALSSDDPRLGALAGAMGSITSEMIAEALVESSEEVTQRVIERAKSEGKVLDRETFQALYAEEAHTQRTANIGKMGAALVTLFARQDVEIGIQTATNAVEHNCIPMILLGGLIVWEAYDICHTCAYEGPEAASKKLGFTVGTYMIGGVAVKGALRLGSIVAPTATEALVAYCAKHPVFAKAYQAMTAILAKGVQKYHNLDKALGEKAVNFVGKGADKVKKVFGGKAGRAAGAQENKGLYDAHEIREVLEKQYPGRVNSSTVPEANARGVKHRGKRHPSGVVFDNKGFPIFDQYVKFETKLSREISKVYCSNTHMKNATKILKAEIKAGKVDSKKFTAEQLSAITKEEIRIPGYTWHHHQDVGKMQLVPKIIHQKTGHVGGMKMWFFK